MARIFLTLAMLLGLSACGDDGGEATGADDDLVGAVEAYARTQIEGDPDELVSARSQGCAQVDTELPVGPADADEVSITDAQAEIDGDEATVSYRVDPGGEQVTDERWVREDGEWKWDNC